MSRARNTLHIAVVLLGLVGVWQLYIWLKDIPHYVLPTPWTTAQTVGRNVSLLVHRAAMTGQGAVLGLVASVVLAVALALLIVRWPAAESVVLTYAVLVRTVPIVGIAPIVTLVAGRGLVTSMLCVVIITVFTLLVSVTQGFANVPPEIGELSDLYATPFHRRARLALLPSAVPSLLHGLRVAAPAAVLGALLAEWLDGFPGVGSLMVVAQANQEVELLMAACITAVVLSLVAFGLVESANSVAARRGHSV